MQYSVTLRNAQLDAVESTVGTTPILRVRTGDIPANCAAADAGTVLAAITLPSDWMANAASGTKDKSGTWTVAAAAAGKAAHWRLYNSAGTTCHAQGLISQAWAGSTAYPLGIQVHNGGNVYKCTTAGTSASSGGPTGTGTGITDGTAVWAYVGPVDMTFDNTDINVGQTVSINTFQIAAGNT